MWTSFVQAGIAESEIQRIIQLWIFCRHRWQITTNVTAVTDPWVTNWAPVAPAHHTPAPAQPCSDIQPAITFIAQFHGALDPVVINLTIHNK